MILLVTTNILLLENIPQTILEKYKPVKKVTIQKCFQNKTKIIDSNMFNLTFPNLLCKYSLITAKCKK